MATIEQLVRLDAARFQQRRRQLVQYVENAWTKLGSWREPDVERFTRQVVPVVAAVQRQLAVDTAAYLAAVETQQAGRTVRPTGIPPSQVSGASVRNGVLPVEVYRRAGVTLWTQLSNGRSFEVAFERATRRATGAAATDLQLTRTHTARRVLGGENARFYRRTLGQQENCGLCVIASTQRYRREDLMPIHPGCGCGVLPIPGETDPGQVIDPDLLERAHGAIEERFGASDRGGRDSIDYRKLVTTREHGELGPVLTVTGHRFTSPTDI